MNGLILIDEPCNGKFKFMLTVNTFDSHNSVVSLVLGYWIDIGVESILAVWTVDDYNHHGAPFKTGPA